MTILFIDFETRSTVDLKSAGLGNYAKHPTTDVWCMGWALNDEPVSVWTPELFGRTAKEVASALDGRAIVAHNAAFELAIWNHIMAPRYGWPALKPEQCRCTMAAAYAMGLPGSLEKAAAAVGIEAQKDMSGRRLMMQMAVPKKTDGDKITWWDEPEKLQALYDYCRQDVKVERELYKRLVKLSDDEQAMWVLDQKINNRGIHVDVAGVRAAIAIVQAETDRLNDAMRETTGGFVSFCTETARLTQWVRSRGVAVDGIAKSDIADVLGSDSLPVDVRRALLIRQEAGKTSTAKLRAMLDAVSGDDRLRGMLQYHGAATGRWAGRRVQLQNIPRWPDDFDEDDADTVLGVMRRHPPDIAQRSINAFYGSPMTVMSWLLRPLLCAAPGNELLAADFANIEGRGLAWLAGEEKTLDAFRAYDDGTGPDIYVATAARILGKPAEAIVKDERQTYGKVPVLACGYQGGSGAFRKIGGKVSEAKAKEIVEAWRASNPAIVSYWYALDEAFKKALRFKGEVVVAGAEGRQVKFRVNGSFLWCRLPSGRLLCYPYPRLDTAHTFELEDGRVKKLSARELAKQGVPEGAKQTRIDYGAAFYMHVDGLSNKWVETDTYGGKLAENITQAVCRDLLAEAIKRCEAAGFPVVLHVHDEIVAETATDSVDLHTFEAVCSETPEWAEGLPVVASGWKGARYRK